MLSIFYDDKGVLVEEIQSITHKEADSSFELVGFL